MAIVARGLGQPEDGALVAAGLGTAEPAAPGTMSAQLVGTGSLTATASTDTGVAETPPSGGSPFPPPWYGPRVVPTRPKPPRKKTRRTQPVDLAATVQGGSTVTATAVTTSRLPVEWDDLALLLQLELV